MVVTLNKDDSGKFVPSSSEILQVVVDSLPEHGKLANKPREQEDVLSLVAKGYEKKVAEGACK